MKKNKSSAKFRKKDKSSFGKKTKRKSSNVKKSTRKFAGVRNYKSAKKLRIPTGIPNYDGLISGGFEKNSTNLLVGGSGSGKSIFATQFLIEGMKRGENCLFITFEEQKEQFYENMKIFGWELDKYEQKGLFAFLEYTPIKVKTMLEEGGGEIERVILGKKINRIVIDSITSFALLFEDELARREAALALFAMIRDWGCTSLLTLEEDPSAQEVTESRTMEFEVDSLTFLYFIRAGKGERQRFLEVIKMRGTEHSKKVYSFEIGKKGIVLSKSPVKRLPSERD